MTDALPDPLVPAEVDLRDFPFTPIFRARLFGSSFHARSSDTQWRVGVTLWLKSWDQVPAGTLPDDDVDLCRLAEMGRDMKAWGKVRAGALHGWRKCSDGRWHHAVVAEGVLEAWSKRSSATKRGKAGAAARWPKHEKTIAELSDSVDGGIAQAMLGDSKGSRSKREVKEKPKTSSAEPQPSHRGPETGRAASSEDEIPDQTPAVEMAIALRKRGVPVQAAHPTLQAWVTEGFTLRQVLEAHEIAQQRKPGEAVPPNYLDAILRNPPKKAEPAWWTTSERMEAKAAELGIDGARPGEETPQFRARIDDAIAGRKKAA